MYCKRRLTSQIKKWYSLGVISLICVSFLSSCSINLPTIKKDAANVADKVEDKISDANQEVAKKLDPEVNDLFDRESGLSRQDIRDAMINKDPPVTQDVPPSPVLPDVSSLLIEPRPPLVGQDKLVSISVTEDVPLRDVIVELARRADVDVEVDPGISGGIIFRAKDKPFSEVIERISELSGLRYSIKNGVLKVERDTPYMVNYRVNILNMIRSNQSSVSLSTQVLSAGVGGEGGGSNSFNSGSNTELSTSYEGDVWQEIENTVNNIIGNYSGKVSTYVPGTGDNSTDEILGAAPAAAASARSGSSGGGSSEDASAVIAINRNSGIVTVLATQRQHREIKEYLDYVIQSQSSQVLIEAKILEVDLSDEYRSGINWSGISGSKTLTANFTESFDADSGNKLVFGVLNDFNLLNFNIDATVNLLQKFGVVKTLSNPRINAVNNQQAVLTFAENRVFFDLDVQNDETGTGADQQQTVTVDSTINTVPIGVIMSLQPSIDLENNEITMNIRPTLSRVSGEATDPGVAVSLATINANLDTPIEGISNVVPIVEVREIDSILRIKSGQVMVIGGLIEERNVNEDRGIPGLGAVPYVGNLFKSVEKTKSVVETVIFIKATIVPGYGVETKDKDFYRTFSTDRRPLAF